MENGQMDVAKVCILSVRILFVIPSGSNVVDC